VTTKQKLEALENIVPEEETELLRLIRQAADEWATKFELEQYLLAMAEADEELDVVAWSKECYVDGCLDTIRGYLIARERLMGTAPIDGGSLGKPN
jgi:hypothetical protein